MVNRTKGFVGKIKTGVELLEKFLSSPKGRIIFRFSQLTVGIWIGTISTARYIKNMDKEIVKAENDYLRERLHVERLRCDSLQRDDIINYLRIKTLEKELNTEK